MCSSILSQEYWSVGLVHTLSCQAPPKNIRPKLESALALALTIAIAIAIAVALRCIFGTTSVSSRTHTCHLPLAATHPFYATVVVRRQSAKILGVATARGRERGRGRVRVRRAGRRRTKDEGRAKPIPMLSSRRAKTQRRSKGMRCR